MVRKMVFYCLYMFLSILLIQLSSGLKIKIGSVVIKYHSLMFSFILLGLLIGLRDGIGIDDEMYYRTYNEVVTIGHSWREIEATYVWICKLFSSAGLNAQCVILFYSVVGCVLIGNAVKELVPKDEIILVFTIFWAFFFADLFTAIRQLLSLGILLNAYVCIKRNEVLKAAVLYVLAVSIHTSAFVGLIYYIAAIFVNKIKPYVKAII